MIYIRRLLVLAPFLCAVAVAEDVTHQYRVPQGLTVTLVAESPLFYNPTAIDIDPDGRIWVAEAVNYRQWNGRNPGRHHEEGDRIIVLEDLDNDGVNETSHVFAQDKDLVAPLGIAVLGDSVVVSCSPHIFIYHDDDGDMKSDRRETFLTGFGGFDHDHGVHSVVPGPDGRWYIAVGNAGPHEVTGSDGSKINSGSIYNGGGPAHANNLPGRISSDGRLWTGGLVMSCNPDGSDLRVLAHNFRNQYEVALDAYGNMYTEDNDDDGNRGCRTTWVMEGGNYGFFSADGTRSWQADRRPGQDYWTAHWHQEDPGVLPAGTQTGAGGPTGVTTYEGNRLAKWIDGAVLDCDAGAGVVYIHRPSVSGAGIDLEQSVLIAAEPAEHGDRARWFRPSDVAVGPDGAVYVADWYDPGVGGHGAGDREAYGRILRIDTADTSAVLQEPTHPLVSPSQSTRWAALEVMLEQGADALPDLEALFFSDDVRARARATWVLARIEPDGRDLVRESLLDDDARIRLAAYRALRAAGEPLVPMARMAARDPDPTVRREVALSLRDEPWDEIEDVVMLLAERLDGSDRVAVEAIGLACDGKEPEAYSALAQRFGGLPSNWDQRFAALAWRLHPEGALGGLAGRANDPLLSRAQRRSAVDAIAFIPSEPAAQTMVQLAQHGPEDVRALASWWLESRSTNDWSGYELPAGFGQGDFEGATRRWSTGAVSEGAFPFELDVTGSSKVILYVDPIGNNAYDWVDWLEPRFSAEDGREWKITELDWEKQVTGWGTLHRGRNAGGEPMRVGERVFTEGIGVHAPTTVIVQVPEGAVSIRGIAGLDEGGTGRENSTTKVDFQVWTTSARAQRDFAPMQARLSDDTLDPGQRAAVVREIARDANGGHVLLKMKREGRLPEAVELITAETLRAHSDIVVRAAALETWPPETNKGLRLPALEKILAMVDPADEVAASRGRVIYETTGLCLSCHSFRGNGGAIGPDLTAIARKYDGQGLLDSMINPNAAISFGYELTTIETTEGGSITGTIIADGPVVVLQDAQGNRTGISAEKVASRSSTGRSPMPSALATELSARDLADVASYLLGEDKRSPILGEPIQLFNGENLENWSAYYQDGSTDISRAFFVEDGLLKDRGVPVGYIQTNNEYESFELIVEWRFLPEKGAGNSGVLMRKIGPDTVWPKCIEAQLWSTNAGDIWNLGWSLTVDPKRTNGRHTVKLHPTNEKPLGEWNHYRILLDGEDLTLEVNGLLQNTAADCEVIPGKILLQAEGAYIEFRKVQLRPIIGHE